jgi:iron complex transport system substrate-binding protein
VKELEHIAKTAIDCGFKIHDQLGPGLLESVYEAVLAQSLCLAGFTIERQKMIPIVFNGLELQEGFRADLIVEGKLIIEIKSVDKLAGIHGKQLLTYLRLMNLPLGLLMNFSQELFKDGLRRVSNNYYGNWNSSKKP